jgi:hypothetical protein
MKSLTEEDVPERRYAVSDWRDINQQLFSMLRLQQIALFIIIGLIVFVSTFNIVSTLIMIAQIDRPLPPGIGASLRGNRQGQCAAAAAAGGG